MPRIALSGTLQCANEEEAELVRCHLAEHVRLTHDELGCLAFSVTETANPMVWQVEEEFRDEAAFEFHQRRVAASAWGVATEGITRDYVVKRVPES